MPDCLKRAPLHYIQGANFKNSPQKLYITTSHFCFFKVSRKFTIFWHTLSPGFSCHRIYRYFFNWRNWGSWQGSWWRGRSHFSNSILVLSHAHQHNTELRIACHDSVLAHWQIYHISMVLQCTVFCFVCCESWYLKRFNCIATHMTLSEYPSLIVGFSSTSLKDTYLCLKNTNVHNTIYKKYINIVDSPKFKFKHLNDIKIIEIESFFIQLQNVI